MRAGARRATGRSALATSVVLVCAVAGAQTPSDPTTKGAKVIEQQPNLRELQPLFRHLALAVMQEIRQLEQRPEGTPGEWAEPLRRLDASLAWRAPLDRLALERMSADEREI